MAGSIWSARLGGHPCRIGRLSHATKADIDRLSYRVEVLKASVDGRSRGASMDPGPGHSPALCARRAPLQGPKALRGRVGGWSNAFAGDESAREPLNNP